MHDSVINVMKNTTLPTFCEWPSPLDQQMPTLQILQNPRTGVKVYPMSFNPCTLDPEQSCGRLSFTVTGMDGLNGAHLK